MLSGCGKSEKRKQEKDGGGMQKMEPKELGNVNANVIAELILHSI